MEEGFTVMYVGWLLIKICLITWSCLFFTSPERASLSGPEYSGQH